MNDTITGTSVLLPTATIDFFLKNKETSQAARDLENDWRFARVTVSVEEGDIETAIRSYEEAASPSLIIIETDTTDDSFVERLEALSAYCDEGTSAIVIGPVNDVDLYRKLTSLGVSDYLVNPVPLDTLSEVIAKTLIDLIGATSSRLISVMGAKGGVGTSSITQALALALSENLKQKTFLMDAAGGWSSLGVGLGFDPVAKISEASRAAMNGDVDSLKRLMIEKNDKLSVLASGSEPMLERLVEPSDYEALIDILMASYPVVLIDLSGSNPALKKTVINRSNEILLVSTPTLPSLRPARTLIQEIKTLHGGALNGFDLLINMQGMLSGKEVSKNDIKTALDREPSAFIPYSPDIFSGSEVEGKMISQIKGGESVINALLPFAEKVSGVKAAKDKDGKEDSGLLGQVLNKLKK